MVFVAVIRVLLEVSGIEKRYEYAIRSRLPDWYPTVNMLMAPVLAALATVRLKIRTRVEIRFALLVLMLCSFLLFRLSFDKHPVATVLVALFVYVELFWLIPKWNSRHTVSRIQHS
jgi:predicted benzoate:H+ symporter BenE